MTNVCHCTNQCKGCGACCQFCQGQCRYAPPPIRLQPNTIPVGDFKFVPQHPLTEEELKRLFREALDEAIKEIRDLKEGGS